MTHLTSLETLRRIAYLLERSGAETYKVRAFRNAAAAIADYSEEQLAAMPTSQLLRIPDVGKTSATVIAEAAGGQTPDYLERLESAESVSVSPEASDLRRRLRGDCHSHSDWSDGGSPIREMAEGAKELGHDYWALTDHSPRLTVAHGLDAKRLREQLEVVHALNDELAPFHILTGIEVDIFDDGSLDQEDDLLAELDIVVASAHSKLRMDAPAMTKRLLAAVANPNTDVLGHCTGRIITGRGRPQSTFDSEAVFRACADTGTAVEINSRPDRLDPPDDLLEQAVSLGCMIVIDTDAHAPGQLEWQINGCEKAARVGIPVDRILNTYSLDSFLQWTQREAA
jgi:putative hydrolase